MRPSPLTKHPLRCTCNTKPLLAMYGKDSANKAYVHVRIYKGPRVYGEVYSNDPISLLCRMCGVWWKIRVINDEVKREISKTPPPVTPPERR